MNIFPSIVLFIFFLSSVGYSQPKKTDSLQHELAKTTIDTSKVNLLNSLAWEYRKLDIDKALNFSNKALQLSEKINFQKGKGNTLSKIADLYYSIGDYNKALDFYTKSLTIRETINDKKGTAKSLQNIGDVNINQGDYKEGLVSYLKSLEIYELIEDTKSMPLNNIAVSYFYLGDYQNCLKYYFKALEIFEEQGNKKLMINPSIGVGNVYKAMGKYKDALIYYRQAMLLSTQVDNKAGLSKSLNNIGYVYEKLQINDTAIDYYLKSLKITEELGDKTEIALSLINIGNFSSKIKIYSKALEYYKQALHINEELGNKDGIAKTLLNIGILYSKNNNAEKAMEYLEKGLRVANSIKNKETMMKGNEELSLAYAKKNDYKNAYTYYRKHSALKDSLLNESNSKNIAEMQTIYETDKKEKDIELLKKNQALIDVELKSEKNVRNGFIIGCLLLLLVILLAYNRYRIKQRANEEIKQKNKEITESISYAKRIQSSFLTSEKYIAQRLSDYFIFYNPRNIVSGDFYWLMEKNGYLYICTADCTGHGIPGAFMSLISMGILNEIIYSKEHLQHTDEILNELRRIIILAVNPEGSSEEGKDGMDAVLSRFNFQKMELEYSAANNSFYIIRNGELLVYKPDKMPVGKHLGLEKPFTKTTIALEKGDCVYTFSDGFADQFGGPNGKKFQSKRLKELLLSHCHKPMRVQKEIIGRSISDWMGTNEQVDDMLVIGIRV